MSWFEAEALNRDRWQGVVDAVVDRGVAAMDRGLFPATLMLTGPRGAGRELAAVELAALLVSGTTDTRPWSDSPTAGRVRTGGHPDVAAILPEETGKRTIRVASVREVVETAPRKPYEGACRVWIVDGVDSTGIETEAANALLKVLEEPPAHAHFILLAETPSAVLPTIRSRSAVLGLPGAVGVAARLGLQDPPELTGRGVDPTHLEEILPTVVEALQNIANGDALAAIRLNTLIAADEDAFSLLAAAALKWAVTDSENHGDSAVRLADASLEADRSVRTLGVVRSHQILGLLLTWMRDTAPDARSNQR